MYAIVKTGGKQYRVEKGQTLLVERLPEEEGAKVALEPLLYRSDDAVFDGADLEKVKVEATILDHAARPEDPGVQVQAQARLQAHDRAPAVAHADRGHRDQDAVAPASRRRREEGGRGRGRNCRPPSAAAAEKPAAPKKPRAPRKPAAKKEAEDGS